MTPTAHAVSVLTMGTVIYSSAWKKTGGAFTPPGSYEKRTARYAPRTGACGISIGVLGVHGVTNALTRGAMPLPDIARERATDFEPLYAVAERVVSGAALKGQGWDAAPGHAIGGKRDVVHGVASIADSISCNALSGK